MTHGELTERIEALANRAETAPTEMAAAILEDAWELIAPLWNLSSVALAQKAALFAGYMDARAFLDAAMTLVPADCWHEIKGPRKYLNIPSPAPNYWSAHLAKWNHEGDVMGWAATPALALCAAALRARNT